MENQHQLISGYRDLSQAEIDKMNQIKALGAAVQQIITELELSAALPGGIEPDQRAAAIAKTHLQTGFMWLVRAVAKPQGF